MNASLFATIIGHAGTEDRQSADVILILGAGLRADNQPHRALTRRAQHGAALYRAGLAPVVLCSGGYGLNRTRSEADACRELLEREGVPRSAILLEERSRSTEENALYSRELIEANGWDRVLLVSDGYHLLRARWIFASQGITPYYSGAPRPLRGEVVMGSVREVAAFYWLAFKTVLGLPYTYVPVL